MVLCWLGIFNLELVQLPDWTIEAVIFAEIEVQFCQNVPSCKSHLVICYINHTGHSYKNYFMIRWCYAGWVFLT